MEEIGRRRSCPYAVKLKKTDPMASLTVDNIFKISRSEESLRWLGSISPRVS